MSAETLHIINWVLLALAYAIGLTNIVLQIRASRRPRTPTHTRKRAEDKSSGPAAPCEGCE